MKKKLNKICLTYNLGYKIFIFNTKVNTNRYKHTKSFTIIKQKVKKKYIIS